MTAGTELQQRITLPLSFTIFFSVLNGMMFQVAVPDISGEFRLLPSEVSWVLTGYILVFALGSLVYGKLSDIYPVKDLITLGIILMNAGSLLGLFSFWYPLLIAARLIQAGGGASIPALAMIVVTRYFSSNLRGRVLGIIASTVAFAAGLGPILGGFISGTLHWRFLFSVSLVTLFAIPYFRKLLPHEKKQKKSFDTGGAVLIGSGSAFLLLFVAHDITWALPLGSAMMAWFVIHIRRAAAPFLRFELFSMGRYRNTLITTFLTIGTVFGMLFMVPLMLRELNGLGSHAIGFTMFPGAMSAAVLGTLGGRLSDKKGSMFVVYLGSSFLVTGLFLLSTYAGRTPWIIALSLVICYTGFAFLQSSLPHTVSNALPREQAGIGMGIYNLLFFISGAFSTAGIGRMLDRKTSAFCLNPFTFCAEGWIYSNIFIMLSGVVCVSALLFYLTFRQRTA